MNADILESRAARAHWLKLADKALKGAYFNETLVSAEGTAAPADLGFGVVIQIPGWEIRVQSYWSASIVTEKRLMIDEGPSQWRQYRSETVLEPRPTIWKRKIASPPEPIAAPGLPASVPTSFSRFSS